MRLGTIALAVLVVAAGCLGSPSTDTEEGQQDEAVDAASEHLDDPTLVGAWGVEPPIDARENDSRVMTHLDETPGDGRAPGWGYRFVDGDQQALVLVASDLGVIAEAYAPLEQEQRDEVASVEPATVTSEQAAEALRANASWPTMDENTTTLWVLEHDDERGGVVWSVRAEKGIPTLFGDGVHAFVDARSGEVLEVERVEGGFGSGGPSGGGCESESSSGRVTPATDVSADADLGGTGTVTVDVEADGAGTLNVTLAGPNGTVWSQTRQIQAMDSFQREAEDLPPGTYEATATTPQGVFDVSVQIVAQWGFSPCPTIDVSGPPTADTVTSWLTRTAPWNR